MSHDYPQGWLTDLANRMVRTHDAEPQLLAFQASAQAWMEKAMKLAAERDEREQMRRMTFGRLEAANVQLRRLREGLLAAIREAREAIQWAEMGEYAAPRLGRLAKLDDLATTEPTP